MRQAILVSTLLGIIAPCSAESISVSLAKCPSTSGAGAGLPALAVIAAPLLETLVKSLGDGLIAASGKNKPLLTVQGTARGSFYALDDAGEQADSVRFNPDIQCISVVGNGLSLSAKIEVSPDGTAIAVLPTGADYKKPLSQTRSVKSLSATIDFVTVDGKTFASASLPLNLKPGLPAIDASKLAYAATGWMAPLPRSAELVADLNALGEKIARLAALPDLISAEKDPVIRAALQREKSVAEVAVSSMRARLKRHGPVSVRVTIAETRDINEFLAAIGEAIGGKSKELAQLANNSLFPVQPSDQERATKSTAIGAYWAKRYEFEELARVNDLLKSDASASQEARSKARIAAVTAQYAALAAAVPAGVVIDGADMLRTYKP